jgi:membrane protease YdiL (CAAX protease family)
MNEFEPNSTDPFSAAPQVTAATDGRQTGGPDLNRAPFWGYDDLAVFALLLVPSFGVSWTVVRTAASVFQIGEPASAVGLLAAQFLGYAVWFLCLWLLLKFKYNSRFWPSIGWVKPKDGILGAVVGGPILAITLAALAAALNTPHLDSPIEKLITTRASLILVGMVVSTAGPLAEELAFRGFMMPLLVRSFGAFFGILGSAIPFALIHGPQYGFQWQNLVIFVLAGCAFGWARLHSGSVIPAVVMHGLYNLTIFAGYIIQKELSGTW